MSGWTDHDLYWLQKSDSSVCPKCGEYVYLMHNDSRYTPRFFICFPCKFVGQSGIGVVTTRKEDAE